MHCNLNCIAMSIYVTYCIYIYTSYTRVIICICKHVIYYVKFHEVLGFWDFYGILGFKVKMHHFEQPARRRVVRKSVECCDFCWISGPQVQLAFQRNWNSRKQWGAARRGRAKIVNPPFFCKKKLSAQSHFFFESATGNSWKQLGFVPLTRQNTSYLKPFKVHFLYKLVLNSSFFAESKVRAPTVPNCFPLHFQKKKGIARNVFCCKKMADWQFWHDHAGPLPTVSDCFSFSGTPVRPVDHWFNKNHNIQHFSSRPFCVQVARNDAFWLWNPIYRKNPKTPRPREIQ